MRVQCLSAFGRQGAEQDVGRHDAPLLRRRAELRDRLPRLCSRMPVESSVVDPWGLCVMSSLLWSAHMIGWSVGSCTTDCGEPLCAQTDLWFSESLFGVS